METDCENKIVTPAAGACNNPIDGICIQTSLRSLQFTSGAALLPAENPRVRVGFIPFRTLNLSEREAYDGHRTRFTYAVTERLAVDHTFMADGGGIEILNDQSVSLFASANTMAHFLVLSHGENKSGGYTVDGVKIPCDSPGIDANNCNENPVAVYHLSETSTSSGPGQFDDTVRFFTRSDVPLWQLSEQDKWDIHQKPPGYVSFLSAPSAPLTESVISGKVRAQQVQVDNVCGTDGSNCFPSSVIAGQIAQGEGVQCPNANQFVAGIANNGPICVDEVVVKCKPGKVLTGLNADGSPICGDIPCGPKQVSICNGTYTLPNSNSGGTQTATGGDSAFQIYECEGGQWVPKGPQGGQCTCVPDSEDRKQKCPKGQKGETVERRTLDCPAGTWSNWNVVSSTCACVPQTQSQTANCASGFSGSIQQTRTFTCPDAKWTGWVDVSNTCVCQPTTENRSSKCPAGFTGNIIEARQNSCPSGAWTAWKQVSNTCKCSPDTETRKVNCPTGLTGEITQQRSFQCPAASWMTWAETDNTCKCVDKKEKRKRDCDPGYTGKIDEERTFSCPAATWSNWTITKNTCQCSNTTETRTIACQPGYNGEITEARSFDCATGTWTSWSKVSDNCKPNVCTWRTGGSAQTLQPFGLGNPAGTTCTCGSASSGCHTGSSGSYTNYTACSCQ